MVDAFLIFFLQIALFSFRTANVRQISKGNKIFAIVTAILFQLCWLFTAYIGVMGIKNGDWLTVISFLLGTAVGSFLGMTGSKKS